MWIADNLASATKVSRRFFWANELPKLLSLNRNGRKLKEIRNVTRI